MKNSDYWKQRFTQLENAQNALAASSLTDIEKQYRQAQKQIEAQISTWYQRFAKNNGITMAEARQWLTGKDLKEFHWSVQEYIQYGQDNAITGQWMQELENASAKFHISKLEALKIHTENSLQVMFAQQQQTISGVMGDVFTSGYYHTAYELQHGFNIGFDIAAVDQSYLEKVLAKPWAVDGYNFSDRIWTNKSKLISELHGELSRGIMMGSDPQKNIDAIAAKMNTSKSNAGRLVMTEEAYFSSAAQKKCFDDLDVEKYEIVATLDSHTSDICQSLDGQIFSMKDFEAGVTAPPFHPNCRSTTAPAFDEDFGQIGERAARDENGETYYVPDDMKYPEWKKAFVDGDKSDFDAGTQMGGATAYTHHKEPEAPKDPTFSEKITKVKDAITANGGVIEETHILDAGKALAEEFAIKNDSLNSAYANAQSAFEVYTAQIDTITQKEMQLLKVKPTNSKEFIKRKEELDLLSAQKYAIMDSDEYKLAKKARDDAYIEKNGFRYKKSSQWLKDKLSEVREMGSSGIDIKAHLLHSRSSVRQSVEDAYSYYPKSWVEKSIRFGTLTTKKATRGYYDDRNGIIAISGYDQNSRFKTAIHELGHRMEKAVPRVLGSEAKFYARRTQGETLQWLGSGYRKSEKTRKDQFIHPYMGKDYGGSAYELVSMGFQYAYTDPSILAADPDMQAWIYGLLILLP